jgi:hypothetical protein
MVVEMSGCWESPFAKAPEGQVEPSTSQPLPKSDLSGWRELDSLSFDPEPNVLPVHYTPN